MRDTQLQQKSDTIVSFEENLKSLSEKRSEIYEAKESGLLLPPFEDKKSQTEILKAEKEFFKIQQKMNKFRKDPDLARRNEVVFKTILRMM